MNDANLFQKKTYLNFDQQKKAQKSEPNSRNIPWSLNEQLQQMFKSNLLHSGIN